MTYAEQNSYYNAVFGEGRLGHIQLTAGGNLEVAATDRMEYSDVGLLIRHTDKDETVTLIPWVGLAYIRTRASAGALRATRPELQYPTDADYDDPPGNYSDDELRELNAPEKRKDQ